MATPEEINIFIDRIDMRKFLNCFFPTLPDHEKAAILETWKIQKETLRQVWLKNSKLTFGQLLSRVGLIPNVSILNNLDINDPIWETINRKDLAHTLPEITQGIFTFLIFKQMTRQPVTVQENIQLMSNLVMWVELNNQSALRK